MRYEKARQQYFEFRTCSDEYYSITKSYIQNMKDEEILERGVEYSPLMNLGRR